MTIDELIAEAQRLSRACVHLEPDGEPGNLAAIWGGPGQVPAPPITGPQAAYPSGRPRRPPEYQHWLTIDCRFQPPGAGRRSGCISVYTESEDLLGVAVHDPLASLCVSGEGRPLYAHSAVSLPPLEAVFLYGSARFREWFEQMGWGADLVMNGPLANEEIETAYAEAQRESLPIDGERVFAVFGGWHVPWPDGDWLELVDHPLVLMTLAESEPWVEVFDRGESFEVFQRVS